ncbi:Alpha/Beta hydrolase protein [Hygrophoropsis aurantiaca]|uniref:Alpha/Beta hydrolase protein n=1 Tax=Hygrophoropsis aurantiaca TaxID=72124 RepID=A0ACB8API0_9AGAM|nr:Alpha/Beta hydrolase protein [Hygrophoropsis aurantiaca]
MISFTLLVLVSLLGYVCAAAVKDIRPLVIWHGLGDTYASPGMVQFQSEVKKMHPGIFVHSIYIDEDAKKDQRAGFYGKVNDQLDLVAAQLASVPELSRGFDAIGFSQGGQFLRAYVERGNSPPIFNLITFGSQHMGISDLPLCSAYDLLCQIARRAARGGVYSEWAQENLIQAQYFRDPTQLALYTLASSFLADINNEVLPPLNKTYAANLASLSNLVLAMFAEDRTVVPKESAWFGSEAPPEEEDSTVYSAQKPFSEQETQAQDKAIIPMHRQPIYTEDWIGLRTLDERGAITLATCPGEHMQITGCWEDLVGKWIGWTFD